MNIYVGNLPYRATEDELRQAFQEFGQVAAVNLIRDRATGESRGFGFVEMPTPAEAQAAITALNGRDFQGRKLVANEARPRRDSNDMGPRMDRGFSSERADRPRGRPA